MSEIRALTDDDLRAYAPQLGRDVARFDRHRLGTVHREGYDPATLRHAVAGR